MAIITPTLNDLIQEGLSLAGQYTTQADAIWTRASTLWIERVKVEIGKRADWELLKSAPYAFSTIAGNNSVALPSDFLRPNKNQFIGRNQKSAVYLSRGGSWYPLEDKNQQFFYQVGDPTQQGFPIYYDIQIGTFTIIFWQTPDVIYNGTLFYFRNPSKLDTVTDANLLARIVDMWRDLIIQGIYYFALLDKKSDKAAPQFQNWIAMIREQEGIDKSSRPKRYQSAYRNF